MVQGVPGGNAQSAMLLKQNLATHALKEAVQTQQQALALLSNSTSFQPEASAPNLHPSSGHNIDLFA